MQNTLFVIIGPTGVGKTAISLKLAELLGCSIISCDSRQMFQELKIGTAAPTAQQLEKAPHQFIGNLSITDHYSAGQYEIDAIPIIEKEISTYGNALLVGGSMLYVDAICKGIDDIPNIDPEIRKEVVKYHQEHGDEAVRKQLKLVDPVHYNKVDLKNIKRILHALEVYYMTGKPFSELHTNTVKKRSFNIVKIGLERPRPELYERINARVLQMLEDGLELEAKRYFPQRDLNALNTVGYKELFNYFDGTWDKETAIAKIQRDTRHYAKKQLTWFKKDETTTWFHPEEMDQIVHFVENQLKKA